MINHKFGKGIHRLCVCVCGMCEWVNVCKKMSEWTTVRLAGWQTRKAAAAAKSEIKWNNIRNDKLLSAQSFAIAVRALYFSFINICLPHYVCPNRKVQKQFYLTGGALPEPLLPMLWRRTHTLTHMSAFDLPKKSTCENTHQNGQSIAMAATRQRVRKRVARGWEKNLINNKNFNSESDRVWSR